MRKINRLLIAKLAKLRRELIAPPGGGGGGPGLGFDVARTGIASVGFVGFPSVVSPKTERPGQDTDEIG